MCRAASPAAARLLDALVERAGIEVMPVDLEQGALARRAFARYGRGRHPAGLNFGDCFAYALATALGESLLFKGGDFSETDVLPALAGLDQPPPGAMWNHRQHLLYSDVLVLS